MACSLPVAGLALACSVEEPTSPTGSGHPSADQRPAGPNTAALTTTMVIDQVGNVGWYTSLASGADGRQHITYQDRANLDLKYAACASACGSASNWTKGFIDQTGSVGQHSSLEVGSNGRRHVAYRDRDQPGSQIRDLRADGELQPGRKLDQGSSRCPG